MNDAAPQTGISVILKGHAWWLVLPAAVVLALLIARLYRKESSVFGRPGVWLRGLRAAVIVLLVLMLSQPVIHRVTAQYEPPVVAVLRDRSPSMRVCDAHESPERRIRAAIALGLLKADARNDAAEKALTPLAAAQNGVETAVAVVRQAAQQDSPSGAGAQGRVDDARRAMESVATQLRNAAALLKDAPVAGSQLNEVVAKGAETAARLQRELGDAPAKSADVRRFLGDKSQSLKALKQELAKVVAQARQLQERADRALAESNKPEVAGALERLARMDRAAVVDAVLEKAQAAAGGVRVVIYNVDTDLRSADGAALSDPGAEGKGAAEDGAPALESARADTDLATPLFRLAERHAHETLAAVVLCSDGRHTSGPIPEDAARAMAARGVALHTLGVGSADAPPDICVARLEGTLSVFLEETIRLTAQVKTSGLKGKRCALVLRRGGKEIQRRELAITGDGWRAESFDLTADKPGANVFTAAVDPLPGEALTANNSAEAVVDVANDRLKVLVVDELPRWETRYVASLLRRERKMQLAERWLLWGDEKGPRRKALPDESDAGRRTGGNAAGALDEYDIIVLGDVGPERMDAMAQKRLASYVADRGGFLIVIAGPRAMPRSYPSGAFADLLPIKQQMAGDVAAVLASGDASPHIRVKLGPDGVRSEIVRVLRDPVLNEQLWPALPELQWVARPAFAKPGATTLLTTDDPRKDAIAAAHSYGAGRVLYLGTDDTWRWRYKVADRVHAVFWSQAFRWGTSNRLAGGERLKVGVDRRQIRPGENVEVLARPRDTQGRTAADAVVVAELEEKGRRQRVQLQAVPGSGGLYRGVLQNVGAGVQNVQVKVESPGFDGVAETLQILAREITGQEGVELSRDAGRLAAMASAGSGRYADILEAPQLFKDLAGHGKQRAQEASYEIWCSYPAVIVIVVLLGLEWLLRKRLGLA
jgi:hypothetical protein